AGSRRRCRRRTRHRAGSRPRWCRVRAVARPRPPQSPWDRGARASLASTVTSGVPLCLYSPRRIEPDREHDVKPHGKLRHAANVALLGALLAAMMVGPLPASADDYPSRPVTLVIPFTAGGPADTAARTIAEVLRRHLGAPIVAENRPAASGITGTEAVARGE